MRVHVALTPAEFPRLALAGRTALVVDVLRATSSVIAACAAGCAGVIPVATPEEARARAAQRPGLLLAGERNGEAIADFDFGNSPLECTPARVGGLTIVLTTTNGTAAMLKAREATAAAVAALTNVSAAAAWAARRGQDVTVLCSGEKGGFSLEDAVCAGLLVERICGAGEGFEPSGEALAAQALGRFYGPRMDRLRADSTWAKTLAAQDRAADLEACLVVDTADMVPVLGADGLITSQGATLTCAAAAADTRAGRRARPDATR
jgi:2-phosphosulfolactate phosphatase